MTGRDRGIRRQRDQWEAQSPAEPKAGTCPSPKSLEGFAGRTEGDSTLNPAPDGAGRDDSGAVVWEWLPVGLAILFLLLRHRLLQWRALEDPPKVLCPNPAELWHGKKKHRGADPGRRQLPAGGVEENGRSGHTLGIASIPLVGSRT